LQNKLKEKLNLDGKEGTILRKKTSILLQLIHGGEAILSPSKAKVKETLTSGSRGAWKGLEKVSLDARRTQGCSRGVPLYHPIQLATPKERLELQWERLAKTNLLPKVAGDPPNHPT
jgi:hypothetical protein